MRQLFAAVIIALAALSYQARAEELLQIAPFVADVTPPVGCPLCDGLVEPVKDVTDPLLAKGLVLLSAEKPIVLCALDWVGVGNTGHDAWREALARAAGTSPDRVVVHCLHQHDAPGCDFEAEKILAEHGLAGSAFDPAFARTAIDRTAEAIRKALASPLRVTHLGQGKARVSEVASNRRVLGPDGKVKYVRYSAAKQPEIRAEPEGTINPNVKLVSFWDGDQPRAVLSYYATHPQSYYGQGHVTCDFPGMARELRAAALPGVAVIHFNGASGNVTAGKYNDGSPANRPLLAQRLADGMKRAWDSTKRTPISADEIHWLTREVALPLSLRLKDEAKLLADLDNQKLNVRLRVRAARDLAFARRTTAGYKTPLTCLQLGPARIVHMPGELFIEYQLAAQQMRPDKLVCLAAYGDYGAGYIGTAIAYTQGGYETGPVSRVAPEVEGVLLSALRELLP